MVEFFSSQEEARVDDILATDISYWIGLADFASEGTSWKGKIKTNRILSGVWKWQESHTEAEYVNWAQGQPNSDLGNQDCVQKDNRSSELWNDRECEDNDAHALCQAQK